MNTLQALLLGLLQGLTEFLPVSSSGHLEIAQALLGVNTSEKDNLLFVVVLHGATVMSTIVVFWKDIVSLFKGFFKFKYNEETQYLFKIAVSMIPVMIIGLFFKDKVEDFFGTGLTLVGATLLLTALLLTLAQYLGNKGNKSISYKSSFLIGLGQAIAVLPGLSRSGTTIATGLLLGNKKEEVAKFSFLMVLIPILGENVLNIFKGNMQASHIGLLPLAVGALAAFGAGFLACKWMINIVKKGKLVYFAIYCALVGGATLVYSLVIL